ncbi:hypothetical protein RMS29_026775 (plasmid) [Agrobacterium rosae]|uniref:Uncharacterized protein n=1 Tax=Agrobacterium rosae TaxID=1972867 RepID=A0ABU4W304_9HYPH|nr:hypothetical protein [Agrobacterium rosae]MDX8332165.1 hypothetical protein [Agrobacterium rosae]
MTRGKKPDPQKKKKAFDLLALIAIFARTNGIGLNDPTLVERFLADAEPRLREALGDPALIHGSRVERLFEATVLSLGRFKLLKSEDLGGVHGAQTYRAPDFRIVLNNGEQWLVEVKNVRSDDPAVQELQMSPAYLASLQDYADIVGTPLKLAIFWSTWKFWSVISPEQFRADDGSLKVSMAEAMVANDFGRLGEVTIMTKPPLRVVVHAAMDMPRSLTDEGVASFTGRSRTIYSGDVELTDPKDRKLAQILMLHGEWRVEGPFPLLDGDQICGVEYVANPVESPDQGWDGIGMASRIFSRHYADQTIDGAEVIQLNGDPAPDWFAPLASWDFKTSKLPLLLGIVQARDPSRLPEQSE